MGGLTPLVVAAVLAFAALADAAPLVRNGDFTHGNDGMPDGWHNDAWARDGVEFSWSMSDAEGRGSAGMRNVQPNDARWCQTVAVEPGGTYQVSARTRTEDVGSANSGAHIAIEPRIADSGDVRGTQDWQPLELVVRAGDETQWEVCVRLGSYANLNTGAAWFTDVALVPVGAPPARPSQTGRTLMRLWEWARASGRGTVLPIVGGALLAIGLGVIRLPRRS